MRTVRGMSGPTHSRPKFGQQMGCHGQLGPLASGRWAGSWVSSRSYRHKGKPTVRLRWAARDALSYKQFYILIVAGNISYASESFVYPYASASREPSYLNHTRGINIVTNLHLGAHIHA
jgi:hypothetical protein